MKVLRERSTLFPGSYTADRYSYVGHRIGAQIEHNFTEKAKAVGMTKDEAKNAFNQNMMSGDVFTDGPRQLGLEADKKWLASSYEAGDVVLHNAYAVSWIVLVLNPMDDPR